MAKLTLSDIVSGYLSADAYNANNALVEAALENTLSLDGTTPNSMGADFDLNSFDLNNVDILNAASVVTASLTLNGQAVTTTTILTGGLTANEVTYDSGALDTKLDSDFLKITGAYSMAGILTMTAGGISGNDFTLTDSSKALTSELIVFDSSRASADGYGSGRIGQAIEGGNTYNQVMGRNVEFGAGQGNVYGRSSDGAALIGFTTDTVDGDIFLVCGPSGPAAGANLLGTDSGEMRLRMRSGISPTFGFGIEGTDTVTINASGLTAINQPGNFTDRTSFTPTIEDGTGANTATYTRQNGEYTQIGNVVFFTAEVTLSGFGDMTPGVNTTRVILTGLPSARFRGGVYPVFAQALDAASFLATDSVVASFESVGNQLILSNYSTTTGCTPLTTDELTTTSIIAISGSYIVD